MSTKFAVVMIEMLIHFTWYFWCFHHTHGSAWHGTVSLNCRCEL